MPSALRHDALLYADAEEYAELVGSFVREGLDAGEPVLVSVPPRQVELLRGALGPAADGVGFADMTRVGRNPARIIPFVRSWSDRQPEGRRRFVGEPIWPGREHDAAIEGWRHEALLNVAFADTPVHILCPYDAAALEPEVLAGARQTHPTMVCDGICFASDHYAEPLRIYDAEESPLRPAPPGAAAHRVSDDLPAIRGFVAHHARAAGLRERHVGDLLIAANEAITNTLVHADGYGTLRLWVDEGAFVCEIADHGCIADPLVGRRQPDYERDHGRGVWLMNQLCDLVQLRSGVEGTTLRLQMRLG